jgi:hypothetical protein
MKRFSESRMREIRTSGSMRGERTAPSCRSLSYSTPQFESKQHIRSVFYQVKGSAVNPPPRAQF